VQYNARGFAVLVIALLSLGLFCPLQVNAQPATEETFYTVDSAWTYQGEDWTWNLSIPASVYNDYQSVSASKRSTSFSFLVTTVDPYLLDLAYQLDDSAQDMNYDDYNKINFIMVFVQSLTNTPTSTNAAPDGHRNFPIETLVQEGGDCEDNSILLATLLTILGYEPIIIDLGDHVAVGVPEHEPPTGKFYYWTYNDQEHFNDKKYYYCETTGGNWKLGECPTDYQTRQGAMDLIFVGKQYLSSVYADEYFHTSFEWSYDEETWTWSIDIPTALYTDYASVSLSARRQNGIGGYGFLTTTQDPYMIEITQQLNATCQEQNYDAYDTVSFVLAFVQSLPYTYDDVSASFDDYPRFPIETIVDNGGDCEDTAILFATIVQILGYGAVYLNPTGHLAVGVLGGSGVHGTYWTYNNGSYFYCETTGDGFKIGEVPSEYTTAKVYPIYTSQQYISNVAVTVPELSPSNISMVTLAVIVAGTFMAVLAASKKRTARPALSKK
jgi:transglutaminase-like putative cysteine protease